MFDIISRRARADRFYRNYNSFTVIELLTGHYKLSECHAASLKNGAAACFLFVFFSQFEGPSGTITKGQLKLESTVIRLFEDTQFLGLSSETSKDI